MPPGTPDQISIASKVTISKFSMVREHATYSRATGREIYPTILWARFHVSLSRTVHGNLSPVCRVNGSFGEIIPAKIITQAINSMANILSACSVKVIRSAAVRTAITIPRPKKPMLTMVVMRRSLFSCSLW